MSEKATLRIRFNLNQRTGKEENHRQWQRASQQFSSVVINQVGLRLVEEEYRKLVGQIRREIVTDVNKEIVNITKLYTQYAMGRTGVRNRSVNLTARMTPESATASFGDWKPLAAETVRRKGHSNFFRDTGRLKFLMRLPQVWTQAFGPVEVTVTKNSSNNRPIAAESLYKDTGTKGAHFKVANISVKAMGRITSEMLPELLTGKFGNSGHNGRATGLLNLLDAVDPRLKQELGNWNRSGSGAYRPTLEPFLAFALGRAIPKAVVRRIQQRNGKSSRTSTALR